MPATPIYELPYPSGASPANIPGDLHALAVAIETTLETALSDEATEREDALAAALPPGSLILWPAAAPPPGWELCDGSAVSRSTYALLFAVIGVTYGPGDGVNTFNLPDLRGRVPVGKSSDTAFDVLGETGGEKTHALSTAELASHTHEKGTIGASTVGHHTHDAVQGSFVQYTNAMASLGSGVVAGNTTGANTAAAGSHSHTISGSTAASGSGTAHNNLQPYIALNYVIKTGA